MSRIVFCQVLKQDAPGLDTPPYPGELGVRIFENISAEGWRQWLDRLTIIINENRLNTGDQGSMQVIEQNMLGFLFGEGDQGHLPGGYIPQGARK